MTVELSADEKAALENLRRHLGAASDIETIRRAIRFALSIEELRAEGAELLIRRGDQAPVPCLLIY
jgi:hypothetical protein